MTITRSTIQERLTYLLFALLLAGTVYFSVLTFQSYSPQIAERLSTSTSANPDEILQSALSGRPMGYLAILAVEE